MLIPVPGKFRTVGLTALRVSNYRGFSMSTSMSTIIIHSPVGAKAEALASWMTSHQMALTELQSRVFNVKMPIPAQKNVKIAALRSKKAKTTLQDEKHRLEVTIPAAELHKVNAYMGCSHCSKRSSIPPGSAYTCENCSEADCTTEPKITFNCDISDGTGTLPMTAFSSTTEKLFKMSAADIFHMKHADDDQAFSAVQEMLRLKPFKVQVSPSTSLSMSNILQWVVLTYSELSHLSYLTRFKIETDMSVLNKNLDVANCSMLNISNFQFCDVGELPSWDFEVFADMEELGVRPDEDTVRRVARAFEKLNQADKKRLVLERYGCKWKYIHFKGERVKVRRDPTL